MLTKVRIAPVEQWCDWISNEGQATETEKASLVGHYIEIETSSCRASDVCNGKIWTQNWDSVNEIRAVIGRSPLSKGQIRYICEHMLELD